MNIATHPPNPAEYKDQQNIKDLEKLAIKYLLITFGVGLLRASMIASNLLFYEVFEMEIAIKIIEILTIVSIYSLNFILGTFILFDARKYCKNKIPISLLGFLFPVFGICFLIVEKYLIVKISHHE